MRSRRYPERWAFANPRRSPSAVAVGVGLALAGCGSDGEPARTTAPSSPPAQVAAPGAREAAGRFFDLFLNGNQSHLLSTGGWRELRSLVVPAVYRELRRNYDGIEVDRNRCTRLDLTVRPVDAKSVVASTIVRCAGKVIAVGFPFTRGPGGDWQLTALEDQRSAAEREASRRFL